ncbi:response regulator [Halobacteriovorax sp. JY17]|uniref:ATP-binding response regulator n=1 Tax=Halobacteriovorax sp. JY17 TaxID=2014617 RepID=UPI000C60FB79|nr:response regulator [Halobacteriovorax sp. JY17]PIK13794.1 MAG: hypothetical protein CES88_12460 [Halobacteriovorax sp. JY17]
MEEFEIELKQSTLNELEDTMNELIDLLRPENFKSLDIDAIFRSAHSLKGNSKAADFHTIASVTHSMEDLLIKKKNEEQKVSESFFDLLLTFSDQIQSSIEELKKDITLMPDFDDLEEKINSFTEDSSFEKSSLRKLLLVDDDIDIYNIVSKYLGENFEIDYVSNAVQAIEDCKIQDYDLIICDYKMPVMNGQEFALYLRQGSSRNKLTPMIFLTAFSPKLFSQKSIWENVFFMDKPIKKKKLKYYATCALQQIHQDLRAS